MTGTRETIAAARSVVVKIGSSALTSMAEGLDVSRLDALADAIEARMRRGSDVVVVSSGAIGAGMAPLGLRRRPQDLATKQAAASVGQLALAHAWGTSFARHGRTVGQVLLTAEDIARRANHRNAQRTLDRLRSLGAVAVVNENDTVATTEIRFGDNDRLAALVAHLVGADALVLLSDVDGLYDGDPRKDPAARLIPEVDGPEDLDGVVAGSGGALGTGGMASKLSAARLAADVEGVSTVLLCRTDAHSAQLLTADVDERDRPFLTGERTPEGYFRIKPGMGVEYAIARGLAYAPYADLLWWETSEPNLDEARQFADAIHAQFPGKMLAYNCSPSFNWRKKLSPEKIETFQREIGAMGYKFQFVTLAGFHSLNNGMFELARGYRDRGMAAYSELQQREFDNEAAGYTATRHQREVGTGYFDDVATVISSGRSSTTALKDSTETAQFTHAA